MSERLPVEVKFIGEPFCREAVIHTLRHLAMRAGWTISPGAQHRILYATTDNPREITAEEKDIVILSSSSVSRHLAESDTPLPFETMANGRFPFPHKNWRTFSKPGWITTDVIAGAWAVLNLWYEARTQTVGAGDWILFTEDWWRKAGWAQPEPVVDNWLDAILTDAIMLGWPSREEEKQPTVLLTHDVDYLPSPFNRGISRLSRSLVRHVVSRKRPGDAMLNMMAYARACRQTLPYFDFEKIVSEETMRGVFSSFQFVARSDHENDPGYDIHHPNLREILRYLEEKGFEICLHGSFRAGNDPARLVEEKGQLEQVLRRKIAGHRQHYLHFHPHSFFRGIENAGLQYDMSVGYNDMAGPRAGTYFPYRPFDIERGRPYVFWEYPLVLMDTTLATGYALSPAEAFHAACKELERAAAARGCVSIIWHQEQLGGLLDPGYDRVYWDLLDDLRRQQIRMTSGNKVLAEFDALWEESLAR